MWQRSDGRVWHLFFPPMQMIDSELRDHFTELAEEATILHGRIGTDITGTSPELIEGYMQERKEHTMQIRELEYMLKKERDSLDDMLRIPALKKGWHSSDYKSLEDLKWELVRTRKEQRA